MKRILGIQIQESLNYGARSGAEAKTDISGQISFWIIFTWLESRYTGLLMCGISCCLFQE